MILSFILYPVVRVSDVYARLPLLGDAGEALIPYPVLAWNDLTCAYR